MTDEKASKGKQPMKRVTSGMGVHLSTDTGGTFTDFVYLDDHGIHGYKSLSTPADPTRCLAQGLERFDSLQSFSHGTTVATNAVLERKGDRTALVTTKGFGDVVFIGRQQRKHLYSFQDLRPSPLIKPEDVFEVRERVDNEGKICVPMDEEEVRKIAEHLSERGYSSAAIVYLFSFLNPVHEKTTAKILREYGINASRSSEVLPEYREYERTSTTLLDAYVRGKLGKYLLSLTNLLDNYGIAGYHVMESEGGVAPSIEISRIPSKGLLSGPAGGISGALHLGERINLKNMITLDMGGTSTDVARITDLKAEYTSNGTISGLPLCRRCLNIITIGAGGGSIASIDSAGVIKVGPESAGANPGPVCYGQGGNQVTVTDVNLLSGYLNPRNFLIKGMDLATERTRARVNDFARELGYELEETLQGVQKVVNHNMAAALRMVSTEAGKDPADYALFAFGGAGPVHAATLARELGMNRMMVPFAAGMFSAYGILISDVVYSYSVTRVMSLKDSNLQHAGEVFDRFTENGRDSLTKGGTPEERQRFFPSVDMRYRGQSYSLNVPFRENPGDLVSGFEEAYEEAYGYSLNDEVEIVNLRLEARGKRFIPTLPEIPENRPNEPYSQRNCLFDDWIEVPIFRRKDLGAGFDFSGACIVEDEGSTIVLPPFSSFKVDRHGNLEVDV